MVTYATVTTSRPRTRWPWGGRQREGWQWVGHRAPREPISSSGRGMETGAGVRSSPLTSGSRTSPSSSRTRGACRSGGDTCSRPGGRCIHEVSDIGRFRRVMSAVVTEKRGGSAPVKVCPATFLPPLFGHGETNFSRISGDSKKADLPIMEEKRTLSSWRASSNWFVPGHAACGEDCRRLRSECACRGAVLVFTF